MNWLAMAMTVVSLLVPFAVKAGEEAVKKLGGDIYDTLKKRFQADKDDDAQEVLDNYMRKPNVYKNTLGDVLVQKAEQNPDDFGAFLQALAEKAGDTGGSGGQTAIGSNIAQADRGSSATVNVNKQDE
jgi:hypothetical protein